MKKTVLTILGYVVYLGGSAGIGWVLGTIAGHLIKLICNEEFAEKHPALYAIIIGIGYAMAVGLGVLIVTYPLQWVLNWYLGKVDSIEDESQEWD